MTPFRKTHSHYQPNRPESQCAAAMSRDLLAAIHGLIARHCDGAMRLKAVVNIVLGHIPQPPTTNNGRGWLDDDLTDALRDIHARPLHKMLDALGEIAESFGESSFSDELDELLDEHGFDYRLDQTGREWSWQARSQDVQGVGRHLDEAQDELAAVFDQSVDHLSQASANLSRSTERARKDAVRDAMSAMESLYKQLTSTGDIKDACRTLREAKSWGPDEIVKDGLSVWDHLHRLYPDIRHGQSSASSMTEEEAGYWISRITTFVKYMAKRHARTK